jgi:hypothetical protein
MVNGTGSSLTPGPGEKGGTDWYIFNGVADWGGIKGGGATLGPPSKASRGELREAGGGDKLPGELAPGLPGSVPPTLPPA